MRVLILLAMFMGFGGSAWAESEYLLTHTNEYKHVIVHVNRAVLLPHKQVISEVVLQTIAMESANQDDEGMYLVASVIVNRARGGSLERVCLARKQFSCWNDSKWAQGWLKRHYTASVQVRAANALRRALNAPKEGIRHYHTTAIKPYWAKGKQGMTHGQHVFYAGIA